MDRDGRQLSQLLSYPIVELGELIQRLLKSRRVRLLALARQLLSELLCCKLQLQRELKRRIGRSELLRSELLRGELQ